MICIAGKNDIAVNVLEYTIDHYADKHSIVCIPTRNDDGVDSWQKSLVKACHEKNIPIVSLEDVYEVSDLVFLSTEFDRIVRVDRFVSDRLFNIHFSLLPRYKGMFPSVLPILNGDPETGVTLHMIRAGIDTGEIIAQRRIPIERDDTSYDLYLKLIERGGELVCEYLDRLLTGDHTCTPQSVTGSTYHPMGYIDYSNLPFRTDMTAYQYDRMIRAFAFRPFQFIHAFGYDLVDCRFTDRVSTGKPGEILAEDPVSLTVSTIDYDIILYKDVLADIMKALEADDKETVKQLCVSKKIKEELIRQGSYQTWMSASV
ncbi:MAG: hypothetical protein K6F54_06885 [Lachnospiraceae bacterium]|nr:hypothetical protein [Lachnospiraceae bacterium]